MKHLLFLLMSAALAASANAAAKSPIANETGPAMHFAMVDAVKINLSRVDPTAWPLPPLTTTPPAIKGWRYFDENRIAGE